jgi:hypothetical protein
MIDGETNTIPRYSFFKDILQDLRNMEKLAPLLMFPANPNMKKLMYSQLTIHQCLFTISCYLLTRAFSAFLNQVLLHQKAKYLNKS